MKDQARGEIQTHAGSYAIRAMRMDGDTRQHRKGAGATGGAYLTNFINKVVNSMRPL
jgi:hypothetical protein